MSRVAGPELQLSVIIPVHDGIRTLPSCLEHLSRSAYTAYECIVVDDGSTDGSGDYAESSGARMMTTGGRYGPAYARNLGAKAARGRILVFLDADVAVNPATLGQFADTFARRPDCDAIIGSYDDSPLDPGLISCFKNLMHHYTHQYIRPAASSFWSGCGAVRTGVFLNHGGFDDSYVSPSIEDIELGVRMFLAGRNIMADHRIQAKHLKTWNLWSLLRTDVLFRGIPWTELILRSGYLPNDLNLRYSQRVSAGATALAVLSLGAGVLLPGAAREIGIACVMLLALVACLNHRFHLFLADRRGWIFSLAAFPLHLLYFLYSTVALIAGVTSFLAKKIVPLNRLREFRRVGG